MASLKAQAAALKVVESIKQGRVPTYSKILREAGYSKSSSIKPTQVTRTKTFRKLVAPLSAGLAEEIERLKASLRAHDLTTEEYKVKIYALDILTKNYQLLTGGATERQVFVLPSEVMERNTITATLEGKEVKRLNGSVEPQLES